MALRSVGLDFIVQLIYVVGHRQQHTFSFHVLCSTAQKTPEAHILFQLTERTLHLDAAVHPETAAFLGKNPF